MYAPACGKAREAATTHIQLVEVNFVGSGLEKFSFVTYFARSMASFQKATVKEGSDLWGPSIIRQKMAHLRRTGVWERFADESIWYERWISLGLLGRMRNNRCGGMCGDNGASRCKSLLYQLASVKSICRDAHGDAQIQRQDSADMLLGGVPLLYLQGGLKKGQ